MDDERDVIHNPVSGETIVVRTSGGETGGRLLAWDLHLAPGGQVPSGHAHPEQEERFFVQEGVLRFRIGTRSRLVGPGQSVTVPPGTSHHFANAGDGAVHVYVETRPALQMEQLLRTAAELAQAQRRHVTGLPRPVDLLLFMDEFGAEVQAPYLPRRLVRAAIRPVVRVITAIGADGRYRRLRSR